MKAIVMRVDTAQSIAVVLQTTGTAGAVEESPRQEREAEHVVVNYD